MNREQGHALSGVEGFTLIELMVVVIIIGILVGIAIPQFTKTMETSKATDAASAVALIANANRMFSLDHSGKYAYGSSALDTACAACGGCGTCPAACDGASPPSCCLTACKYLGTTDWDSKPFNFYAAGNAAGTSAGTCGAPTQCDGGSSVTANVIACAQRKPGSSPGGTDICQTDSCFSAWGYAIDKNGIFGCYGLGVPPPPR